MGLKKARLSLWTNYNLLNSTNRDETSLLMDKKHSTGTSSPLHPLRGNPCSFRNSSFSKPSAFKPFLPPVANQPISNLDLPESLDIFYSQSVPTKPYNSKEFQKRTELIDSEFPVLAMLLKDAKPLSECHKPLDTLSRARSKKWDLLNSTTLQESQTSHPAMEKKSNSTDQSSATYYKPVKSDTSL